MTGDRFQLPDDGDHLEAGVDASRPTEADAFGGSRLRVEADVKADADIGTDSDPDADVGAMPDAGIDPDVDAGGAADAEWRFDRTGTGPGDAAWHATPRRLSRPPSLRYAEPGSDHGGGSEPDRASGRRDEPTGARDEAIPPGPRWAIGIGVFAALIPSVILVVFASLFGFTAGLVVVGIFVGRIVGISVRGALNSGLSSDARTLVAIVITLAALAISQVAIWLLALREGGDLPLVDFLSQTYGPVVPLEAMLGTIAAWWSAR